MISQTIDGYVCNQPKEQEGQYGRFVELSLKTGTTKRQLVYVSARFYGKKIRPILDFVQNGDYMTISGSVESIFMKEREAGGSYVQVYLKDAFFSLPPKVVGEARFRFSPDEQVKGLPGFDD